MLTQEENALLTQVGPGTPGGELLRLKENIARVQRGEDPMGVIRDPGKYQIIEFSMSR
jgi:hypothetical protein